MNYYNEIEPFAAAWIRNLIAADLIPPGDVDTRSIKEVTPNDIQGYTQCHFFAGIAGWSLALQIAGVAATEPVWTGSCPCQPYSAAGKGEGDNDPRNLWPDFFRLIRECRPECVIGEQVENAIGHGWLDGVSTDLEGEGYAVGACVLGAHSVGAPHIRQRLYWVADANGVRFSEQRRSTRPALQRQRSERGGECPRPEHDGELPRGFEGLGASAGSIDGLALPNRNELQREPSTGEQSLHEQGGGTNGLEHTAGDGRDKERTHGRGSGEGTGTQGTMRRLDDASEAGGLGNADSIRQDSLRGVSSEHRANAARSANRLGDTAALQRAGSDGTSEQEQGTWARCIVIPCRDNKARRISSQSGDEPLATGIPRDLGRGESKLRRMAIRAARANRVGRLKGYGNAIVPEVAAEFIRAFMEDNR